MTLRIIISGKPRSEWRKICASSDYNERSGGKRNDEEIQEFRRKFREECYKEKLEEARKYILNTDPKQLAKENEAGRRVWDLMRSEEGQTFLSSAFKDVPMKEILKKFLTSIDAPEELISEIAEEMIKKIEDWNYNKQEEE